MPLKMPWRNASSCMHKFVVRIQIACCTASNLFCHAKHHHAASSIGKADSIFAQPASNLPSCQCHDLKPRNWHCKSSAMQSLSSSSIKRHEFRFAVRIIGTETASVKASTPGNRSCPEISRGSRVSRRVARVWACAGDSRKFDLRNARNGVVIEMQRRTSSVSGTWRLADR